MEFVFSLPRTPEKISFPNDNFFELQSRKEQSTIFRFKTKYSERVTPDQFFAVFILLAIALTISFSFSTFLAYQEFKFWVWGKQAEASIVRTFDTKDYYGRGWEVPRLAVVYSFTNENGDRCEERDDVSPQYSLPADTILIEYLPGVEDSSRIKTTGIWLAVVFFFGCLITTMGFVFWITRQANAPIPKSRYRRARLIHWIGYFGGITGCDSSLS